ncbi:MAG: hypothetical protein WCG05_02860 [Alphaproteobacteria bacterium]
MTKFKQIFFVLVSIILIGTPFAFGACWGTYPVSVQSLSGSLKERCEPPADRAFLYAIEKTPIDERDSVLKLVEKLANPAVHGWSLVYLVSMLRDETTGNRGSFFTSLEQLISAQWPNELIDLKLQTSYKDDFSGAFTESLKLFDVSFNITTIINDLHETPVDERASVAAFATRLITPGHAYKDNYSTNTIKILNQIPAAQRAACVTEALSLYQEAEARKETQGVELNAMRAILQNTYRPKPGNL